MNNLDYLNLSTDLRRISQWLMEKQDDMVEIFMPKLMKKFGSDEKIKGKKTVKRWLEEIRDYKGGRERAAERALTLSAILLG